MSVCGPELREKAYRLCRDYLSGAWKKISPGEMVLKPVSGGLSNLLYFCALPNTHQTSDTEPHQVLLRMYGRVHDEGVEAVITQSVIFTLLSERQLGPKLFGVFPGGRLEEYIPSRSLKTSELQDPEISCIIAEKLAQVHSLQVPISKEPAWLFDTMNRWLQYIQRNIHLDVVPLNEKSKMKKLLSCNLELEFDWLRKTLVKVGSPVVFCHNDLQEGNILINEMAKSPEDKLFFIDFEYCSYNYRGFDLANHFCEWCYNYNNPSAPYFSASLNSFPTREHQLQFVRVYLETMKRLPPPLNYANSNNMFRQHNSAEAMLREINIFILASHFFWGLWSVVNAHVSSIPFGYWDYAVTRFDGYFQQKEKILTDANNRKPSFE